MASYRTYLTPLYVPCGIAITVFASMRPAARDGDETAAVTTTTAARVRIVRKGELMEDLRQLGLEHKRFAIQGNRRPSARSLRAGVKPWAVEDGASPAVY